MDELAFPVNKFVIKQIDSFELNPSNNLLLYGPIGVGKLSIAKLLANKLSKTNNIANSGQITIINFNDVKSSIDEIRNIRGNVILKSTNTIDRVFILDNFEKLSLPAYNAFLKTLEEPPAGICFIICASDKTSIPVTILSRLNSINVIPPNQELSIEYFKSKYPKITIKNIEKIFQLNSGLPRLIDQDLMNFDLTEDSVINLAKRFFSVDGTEKLMMINELYKSREDCALFLKMVHSLSEAAIKNNSKNKIWQKMYSSSLAAVDLIESNSQPRLVLLNFVNEII